MPPGYPILSVFDHPSKKQNKFLFFILLQVTNDFLELDRALECLLFFHSYLKEIVLDIGSALLKRHSVD